MSNMLTNQSVGKDANGNNVVRGAIYDPASTQTVNGTIVRTMFPGNVTPQNRISTRPAAVLAYINGLLLRTLPAIDADRLANIKDPSPDPSKMAVMKRKTKARGHGMPCPYGCHNNEWE